MGALVGEMMQSGVLVDTGGTSPTNVQFRAQRTNGSFSVTDGPFTESKEIVGGFAVFDVKSKQEMIDAARRFRVRRQRHLRDVRSLGDPERRRVTHNETRRAIEAR